MKKNGLMIACSCLLILFVSCNKQSQNQHIVSYKTMEVKLRNLNLQTTYSAAIRGRQDIGIFPQVSGFITKLCIKEGEHVKKGQTLFIIDQVTYQAALRVAEANVKSAEAVAATNQLTYDSKKILYEQNVISKYDLQLAENNLLTAKAQVAQAQANEVNAANNLSYTVVKSPCDGVVGTLPFREGSLVSPQMAQALTTVSDNSEMYIYFSMTEMQLLQLINQYGSIEKAIKEMPGIRLLLCNDTLYPEEGRIESLSGVIDRSTGAASVRAVFPNPDRSLMSGGSCTVVIPYDHTDAVVIPQEATYEIQNMKYVYKIVDGKAQSTIIDVSPISNGKEYIVESGLRQGDIILSEGAGLVHEGDVVNITKEK